MAFGQNTLCIPSLLHCLNHRSEVCTVMSVWPAWMTPRQTQANSLRSIWCHNEVRQIRLTAFRQSV